jgi:hypothetical protein
VKRPRFAVAHTRDIAAFNRYSDWISSTNTRATTMRWLEWRPLVLALLDHLASITAPTTR